MRIRLRRRLPIAVALLVGLSMVPAVPALGDGGFRTSVPAMLTGEGVSVVPIISVGDTLADGYRFEAIPDGVAVDPFGRGRAEVYVNHETSTVPFPAGVSDFDNAQLSRLDLGPGVVVLGGDLVITSEANYQRFCSNTLTHGEDGFESRALVFTNEEASDFVNREGIAYPGDPADPSYEQAGVVVAYDPDTGEHRTIYGMGRHNHENSVAIPGYDRAVILSGDDTFSAPGSQLYMYLAKDADAVWADEGHLWAFKGEDGFNDYGDLTPGASIGGRFIRVPDAVADGDQTGLETWSNDNNVFQFIRVEDIAYDRTNPNVVYLADTGEPRALPDPATGRLLRAPSGTEGPYPNGRIFRMELDPNSPRRVASLSILIDGDALGAESAGVIDLIHNPDNLETTARSLLIQEDPGSQNRYAPDDPAGTTARVWRYDLATGVLTVVARVDQSLDPEADLGEWESSGIVDASAVYGPGAFLVTIQAHTINIEEATIDGTLFKREHGQLVLLRIPGA